MNDLMTIIGVVLGVIFGSTYASWLPFYADEKGWGVGKMIGAAVLGLLVFAVFWVVICEVVL